MVAAATHPFAPRGLRLAGYQPNVNSQAEVLAALFVPLFLFATSIGVVVSSKRGFRMERRVALTWLLCNGAFQFVLNAYLSVWYASVRSRQDFLGQLWKELAMMDSRFLTSNTLVWLRCVWLGWIVAPLCVLAFVCFMRDWPQRYYLQLLAASFELLHSVTYVAAECADGFRFHAAPYDLIYFWLYFVFFKGVSILASLLLLVDCYSNVAEGQRLLDAVNKPAVAGSGGTPRLPKKRN